MIAKPLHFSKDLQQNARWENHLRSKNFLIIVDVKLRRGWLGWNIIKKGFSHSSHKAKIAMRMHCWVHQQNSCCHCCFTRWFFSQHSCLSPGRQRWLHYLATLILILARSNPASPNAEYQGLKISSASYGTCMVLIYNIHIYWLYCHVACQDMPSISNTSYWILFPLSSAEKTQNIVDQCLSPSHGKREQKNLQNSQASPKNTIKPILLMVQKSQTTTWDGAKTR